MFDFNFSQIGEQIRRIFCSSPKKKLKPIPEFNSEKEEAEFWDNSDMTEYIDFDNVESIDFVLLDNLNKVELL